MGSVLIFKLIFQMLATCWMSVSYILQLHHTSASAPSRYFTRPFHVKNAKIQSTARCLARRIVFSFLLYWNLTGVWVERLESSLKCLHRLPLHMTRFQTFATMPI